MPRQEQRRRPARRYLRTLGASSIEKSSVARVEPAAAPALPPTAAEVQACSIEAMRNGEECEACQ